MKYIGIDEYGETFYIKSHPRKELMEQLYTTHADKIYVDRMDGTYHIGYIICGHWINVYGLEGITFAKKEQ